MLPNTKHLSYNSDDRHILDNLARNGRFRVAIFWSSRIADKDSLYQEARQLAYSIALSGYDLVTGWGPGIMQAASQWHSEACHDCLENSPITAGINIQLPHEQQPNPFLDISSTKNTFSERLDTFMLLSNVFVVATGGIGTLLELFYTWQLMQVHHICRMPIILWGEQYFELRAFIQRHIIAPWYASPEDLDLIIPVETIDDVKLLVDMAYQYFIESGPDVCINIKHYTAAAQKLGLVENIGW